MHLLALGLSLVGQIVTFLAFDYFGAQHAGEHVSVEMALQVGTWHFHFHHWFLSGTLLVVLMLTLDLDEPWVWLVLGACLGTMTQGLQYQDRFQLVW